PKAGPPVETSVELTGWQSVAPPAKKAKPDATKLELPCFHLLGAQRLRTTLRFRPTPGAALQQPTVRQLTPLPGSGPQHVYTPATPVDGGSVLVRPGPRPGAQDRTLIEVRDSHPPRVRFTSTLDCRDEARALSVRLRQWEGEAKVEGPPGAGVVA